MLCNNAKAGVSVFFSSFFFGGGGGGCGKNSGCLRGVKRKMKATQGGVQNSYMDNYEFFRPTPGDKYRLVPKEEEGRGEVGLQYLASKD